MAVKYGLGLPLPEDCALLIERFRSGKAAWAVRPMRSDPHVSIKGPAGLSESSDILDTIAEVAAHVPPFPLQLTGPAMFDTEPTLYLGVDSPGWWQLHRMLVDSIAARTGAEMHPWETSGWIPHATVLRAKPELGGQRDEIIEAAAQVLAPFPCFQVTMVRMYGQANTSRRGHLGRLNG